LLIVSGWCFFAREFTEFLNLGQLLNQSQDMVSTRKRSTVFMTINWKKIQKNVKKLQMRIAKAVREHKFHKAKSIFRLLTNSFYAKLLAVFRVTTNKGGKTAGVDKVLWSKHDDLTIHAQSLTRRGYKPQSLRRIYIPKRNGKQRPLGIPTMKDRAMQALYLLGLEPIAETLADLNSYGFRKHRSCRDAIKQIFICLSSKTGAKWIYEADIKGCFDNISHEWLLKFIPMDKQVLQKWLKCGFLENKRFFPTIAGTPQGGIISPTLMNMVLDGLERLIKKRFPRWKNYCKVNFIRYADDFIITAASREIIEKEIIPLVTEFLEQRGLSLSPEKTKITHINDGFDFLSQNSRKYRNGKLFQMPSKNAVKEIKHKLRVEVFRNLGAKPHDLIHSLNSILRGWTNYHKHIVSKEIFKEIDYYLWRLLGKWCKRRHPNKPWKWIRNKYFSASGELCSFSSLRSTQQGGKVRINKIFRAGKVPIIRHVKIVSSKNPYLKDDEKYFADRRKDLQKKSIKTKQNCVILRKINEIDKTLLNLWKLQLAKSKKKSLRNARAA